MTEQSGGTVSSTYRWENGNVMTFGQDGEQIPELQGPFSRELWAKIRARSTPRTEWIGWDEDGAAVWPQSGRSPNSG